MQPRTEAAAVIAIAGSGPVAQAMGRALRERGFAISYIASRNAANALAAAEFIGGGVRAIPYGEIPVRASHVFVAVSDRAIGIVADELAASRGGLRIALHSCGAYGPEALAPLAAVGVSCGGIHPLQTIRDPAQGARLLQGAAFAVCGDPDALAWAKQLGSALSGHVLRIDAAGRKFYHAAAVMASNYIAALLDCAEQLMVLAGTPKEDALRALTPLTRATIENVVRCGAVEALTGPIVRGDADTVKQHSIALESAGVAAAELYRAAGLCALRMARERGLGEEQAEKVHRALLGRK